MQRKPKRCAICRERFTPFSTLSRVCGTPCAIQWATLQRAKAERKQTREWRKANMTRGDLLKKAQTEFNRFIRLRDNDKPCISCGVTETGVDGKGGRFDCSHYRSVGSAPELRFEESNAHKACKKCNQYLSGNIVEYRAGLIVRIGLEKLAWLEGPHPVQKYSRDDLREIADKYRASANELNHNLKGNEQ